MVGSRSSLVTLVFFVTVILVPSTSGMIWSSFSGVFSFRSPITTMVGSRCGVSAATAGAAQAKPVRARTQVFGESMNSTCWRRGEERKRPAANSIIPLRMKEARREGDPPGLLVSAPGERSALGDSKVDAGGNRLELADPLAKVGDLDSAGRGRKSALAGNLRQLHFLELEPAVPGLESRERRAGKPDDDARAQHSKRQRVHHFSSWRSASISRASSSFWLLM